MKDSHYKHNNSAGEDEPDEYYDTKDRLMEEELEDDTAGWNDRENDVSLEVEKSYDDEFLIWS